MTDPGWIRSCAYKKLLVLVAEVGVYISYDHKDVFFDKAAAGE